jgi:hypothetical protein
MPQLNDIRKMKCWSVHGRTWLTAKGEGTKRVVTVLTEPHATPEQALALGHAAMASLEEREPDKVEVEGVSAGELVYTWGSRNL